MTMRTRRTPDTPALARTRDPHRNDDIEPSRVSGKRISATNRLSAVVPELVPQWHPTKNGDLTPDDVTVGSIRPVWWHCPKDPEHEWKVSPNLRTRFRPKLSGCPFCSGKRICSTNSLSARFPALAAEWHRAKNHPLTPHQVAPFANRKVWWRCPRDQKHVWQADISGRAGQGRGCPYCAGQPRGYAYSLAVRAPALAASWHPTKNGSLTPADVGMGSNRKIWWTCPEGPDHEWRATVIQRTRIGTGCPCCANLRLSATNCLAARAPAVSLQWHPTLNGALTPRDITYCSTKYASWKCPSGHTWRTVIRLRTIEGTGCPTCFDQKRRSQRALTEERRRQSLRPRAILPLADLPDLMKSLHPHLNGDIDPRRIGRRSAAKLWWRCENGPDHVWRAEVRRRMEGSGCPHCAGLSLSVTNRLSTAAPDVARQWHPTKNGDLSPDDVRKSYARRVWWRCEQGPDHEWQASVAQRTGAETRCPFCAGKRTSVTNRLSVLAPSLAAQWHPTKNRSLTADNVVMGSSRRVWWQCPKAPDHVWGATVNGRVRAPSCPFCTNARVSMTNRLSTVAPDVARQWHLTKNGAMTPDDVLAGTSRFAWWRCPEGPDHEWQATIASRAIRGTGCPFCSNLRASVKSCLATKNPELAAQWHPTKNGKLTARDVTPGSARKVWWKCPRNPRHQWQTDVTHRARNGCPHCSIQLRRTHRRLASVNPALAATWHPTKNGDLTPLDVTAHSRRKVWWKCPRGPDHEWEMSLEIRSQGRSPCPFCAGLRLSITSCLAIRFPAFALQWHWKRNGSLWPWQIYAFSSQKVWWQCPAGHAWQSRLDARTRKNAGCPGCRHRKGRRALTGKRRRKVWLPGDWK